MGLTDKKNNRSASISIDAGDRERLSKFCNAFKLSKEIDKPNVNDDDGYYELSIWLVDRSYFNLLIIFTKHDGAVIRNGTKYYRNDELVTLTEKMLKQQIPGWFYLHAMGSFNKNKWLNSSFFMRTTL